MSLKRGIPATGGVKDPKARQVLDAIIENLRDLKPSAAVAETIVSVGGAVARGVRTALLRLVNSGGGTPVGVSLTADTLTLRTLSAGANISVSVVDGAIVIATTGSVAVSGVAPIEVSGAGAVSINVPGLAAETFAAGSHVFLVHNGAAYKKASLGNFAGVSSAGQAQWKIPVVDASGGIVFKTVTELLLGAVTTTKDPVAGDKPLTLDAVNALFWANSAECL